MARLGRGFPARVLIRTRTDSQSIEGGASGGRITHAVATATSTNARSTYVTTAFSPASSDTLVVFVTASFGSTPSSDGSVGLTDSTGEVTFTRVASAFSASSQSKMWAFIANARTSSTTSRTITFTTGDQSADCTGCIISVTRISGMSKTGSSALKQAVVYDENQAAGSTPVVSAFASSCLAANLTIAAVHSASNVSATPAYVPPAGWTEYAEIGYNNPGRGFTYVGRDDGSFTGTTITWTTDDATAFADIMMELDMSSSFQAAWARRATVTLRAGQGPV